MPRTGGAAGPPVPPRPPQPLSALPAPDVPVEALAPAGEPRPAALERPAVLERARGWLPRGRTLPDVEWDRRQRWLLVLLWLHVPALVIFGLLEGQSAGHLGLEAGVGVGGLAALATWVARGREAASVAVAVGLLTSSALVVHISGGVTEAHFHFFVMIVVLTLYEDWTIFGLATGFVVVHHLTMGLLAPGSLYDHGGSPFGWAAVHAGYIAAAGLAAIGGWRLNEDVRLAHADASARAEASERTALAALAELERSNRDLEQFASIASHDLQEPLRTVSGFLGLLERRHGEALGEEGRELVGHAIGGAKRMRALIDGLQEWTRTGATAFRPERVDVGELLDEVLAGLESRIEATGARVERRDLPVLRADRELLGRALLNLVGNALKFSGDEPPHVEVQGAATQDPDGREGWTLAVRDHGIGIEPAHAARVFEMFSRLHAATGEPGSGIGLAVVARVAEAHGGRVDVAPAPGGGSVFRLWIPA